MIDIPVELQELICEHCTPQTLASLAQTSTHFLNVSRPVLYRHVTISYRDTSPRLCKRFRDTVVGSSDVFGPLIKSLDLHGSPDFDDSIASLLRVLPNLLRLSSHSLPWGDPKTNEILSCISPKIRACAGLGLAPTTPSFVAFLQSHPELHEWHGRCFDVNETVGALDPMSFAPALSAFLERITLFEVNLWPSSFTLLKQMRDLTHLSFMHRGAQQFTREILRSELDAIRECGKNLVSLDLSDIPADWGEPVPWTVNKVLPLTPTLQYLRVGQHYNRRGKDYNVRFTRTPKQLDSALFTVPSTSLPHNLQLMTIDFPRRTRVGRAGPVGREDSESSALRQTGLKDAETMRVLMPSLVEFVYYCHSFRRTLDEWLDISNEAARRSDEEWGAELHW